MPAAVESMQIPAGPHVTEGLQLPSSCCPVHGQNRRLPAPCVTPIALSAPCICRACFCLQVLACQQLGERPCLAAEDSPEPRTHGDKGPWWLCRGQMRSFPAVGTEPGQGVGLEQFPESLGEAEVQADRCGCGGVRDSV